MASSCFGVPADEGFSGGNRDDERRTLRWPCTQEWDVARYKLQKIIKPGGGSHCQHEVHMDRETGHIVFLKRFSPQCHCGSPLDFHRKNPAALQNPWNELRFAHELGQAGAARNLGFSCYIGTFRDPCGDVLCVSEWMHLGDLFDWISGLEAPGPAREAKILPILWELLSVVSTMHSTGVAHCRLSLEKVLLRATSDGRGSLSVALTDFSKAVSGEAARAICGVLGPKMYQAPEVHKGPYDAFAADLFACGVMAFSLAVGWYPWRSTMPGEDGCFKYSLKHGFTAFLRRWAIPSSEGICAADVISPGLTETIGLLLSQDPSQRRVALLTA